MRREAGANPAKAGVLAVLAVVAIYFWAPLVVGWCGKGGAAGKNQAVTEGTSGNANATAPAVAATPASEAATEEKTLASIDWRKLCDATASDPRTKPVRPLALARDPFKIAASQQKAVKKEEVEGQLAAPPPTPQTLGLSLAGTVVGADRRVARLGGKNVIEGQTIEVTKDGKAWQFQLVRVEAKRIVLARDSEQFELTMPKAKRSGQIELTLRGN